MPVALYYLAISFLFAHELDAVTHAEWRLLFVLRDLDALTAAQTFVALHVPLLFAILWFSHHENPTIRDRTRLACATLFVVHAILHFALSGSPEYDFDGLLSRVLILMSAVCGAGFLVANRRSQAASSS